MRKHSTKTTCRGLDYLVAALTLFYNLEAGTAHKGAALFAHEPALRTRSVGITFHLQTPVKNFYANIKTGLWKCNI